MAGKAIPGREKTSEGLLSDDKRIYFFPLHFLLPVPFISPHPPGAEAAPLDPTPPGREVAHGGAGADARPSRGSGTRCPLPVWD